MKNYPAHQLEKVTWKSYILQPPPARHCQKHSLPRITFQKERIHDKSMQELLKQYQIYAISTCLV